MSRRTSWTGVPCPIARAVDVLGEPWTLLILRNATTGTTRFDVFRAELGIADNVLAARLARLVDAGLLVRRPYRDGGRTREEYRLTQAGADALPVLEALGEWGARYTASAEPTDPMQVVHLGCGEPTRPGRGCDACGAPLRRSDLGWRRPWRSPEPVPLAEPVA
ncbi:helix-turn-helix domain-containing protein [Pseudonocardia aurantiaca]|uniref:Winged helix-turn-helix transcriptional regulator n=1 Tax=Pseudonocardia aurantiaca TaxID=75290 RepID=A0ABW4FGD3_9PSEU